jgi:hypothetical protein
MSLVMTGVKAHDDTVQKSVGVRQAAVAAAGNNQASVNTAEITHLRTCIASAIANKCGVEPFLTMLRTLGFNN